jgi:uncharacterized protein with HEPN domain
VKDDLLYLDHIAECIVRVQRYTANGREAFSADTKTQDAVIRNLQVLAESCTRLSESTRSKYPEIDWRAIAGFRNVVVHDYLHLDLDRVWLVVESDLSLLASVVDRAIRELTPSEDG